MEQRHFLVMPLVEGPVQQIHLYITETAREAVRAHGRPGEWLVVEGSVWNASPVIVAEGREEAT